MRHIAPPQRTLAGLPGGVLQRKTFSMGWAKRACDQAFGCVRFDANNMRRRPCRQSNAVGAEFQFDGATRRKTDPGKLGQTAMGMLRTPGAEPARNLPRKSFAVPASKEANKMNTRGKKAES